MCGFTGAWGTDEAQAKVVSMLHFLQNRGKFGAGLVALTAIGQLIKREGYGNVLQALNPDVLKDIHVRAAIAHNRYVTAADEESLQPLLTTWGKDEIALGHNGNYTNTPHIMTHELSDIDFETKLDSECLLQLIINARKALPQKHLGLFNLIDQAAGKLAGSGTCVILTKHGLYVLRDGSGNRPAYYGELPKGGYLVASEESALLQLDILEPKEVPPGTIMCFSDSGIEEFELKQDRKPRQLCSFELVYFSMYIGRVFGVDIVEFREKLGENLAISNPVTDADIILGVPSSGIPGAFGFARKNPSGVFDYSSMMKHHNAGRVFIADSDELRHYELALKWYFDPRKIKGKVVVVVDDSIVRGPTAQWIVKKLRHFGAKKVYFYSLYPIVGFPCNLGINTPTSDQLAIVKHKGVNGVKRFIGADELIYTSEESFKKQLAQEMDPTLFCTACIDGNNRLEHLAA